MKQFKLSIQIEIFSLVHQDDFMLHQLQREAKRAVDKMQEDLRAKANVTTLNATTYKEKQKEQ